MAACGSDSRVSEWPGDSCFFLRFVLFRCHTISVRLFCWFASDDGASRWFPSSPWQPSCARFEVAPHLRAFSCNKRMKKRRWVSTLHSASHRPLKGTLEKGKMMRPVEISLAKPQLFPLTWQNWWGHGESWKILPTSLSTPCYITDNRAVNKYINCEKTIVWNAMKRRQALSEEINE